MLPVTTERYLGLKVPDILSDFDEILSFLKFSYKLPISNFMQICPVAARTDTRGRAG
jgi:hypothetical protein